MMGTVPLVLSEGYASTDNHAPKNKNIAILTFVTFQMTFKVKIKGGIHPHVFLPSCSYVSFCLYACVYVYWVSPWWCKGMRKGIGCCAVPPFTQDLLIKSLHGAIQFYTYKYGGLTHVCTYGGMETALDNSAGVIFFTHTRTDKRRCSLQLTPSSMGACYY